jgi:hypothetical protein
LRNWRLILVLLAISCVSVAAQDQNAPPVEQDQAQQNQQQQNQSSPQQGSPEQNPAPQNQPPQSQPTQEQKDTSSPQIEKKQDIPGAVAETTKKFGVLTLNKVVDWETGWLTGPYVGKNRDLVPMTAQQRRRIYWEQTFTAPGDYIKRMVPAAFDQWRDTPAQWGQGWGAYGERFGSREGQFIASNGLTALGDAMLKYEPRYDQCKCSGFKLRTRHAILRNFVTYDHSEQDLHPQWALYGGAFAGGMISSTWKPRPQYVFKDGAYGMLGQAAYGTMLNFFTEYAGDINRKIHAKLKKK